MATEKPEPDPEPDDEPDDDEESGEESEDEPEQAAAPAAGGSARTASSRADRSLTGPLRVSDASGLILGLLVWGWFVVPYFRNGKQGVADVLTAKFTNRRNGEPLP